MSKVVLSREAYAALMTVGSNRIGSRVCCPDPATWQELIDAGMIRGGGGLTRAGSITRERHADALMDDAFGQVISGPTPPGSRAVTDQEGSADS